MAESEEELKNLVMSVEESHKAGLNLNIKKAKMMAKVKSLIRVQLLATPWPAAYQSHLSMGFSRQEYWSELPCPLPGDLPDAGQEANKHIKCCSFLQRSPFTAEVPTC